MVFTASISLTAVGSAYVPPGSGSTAAALIGWPIAVGWTVTTFTAQHVGNTLNIGSQNVVYALSVNGVQKASVTIAANATAAASASLSYPTVTGDVWTVKITPSGILTVGVSAIMCGAG